MHDGVLLLVVGAVLAASIVVALVAARTGLPLLVAFLGLGMLLGSDGPGGIEFEAVPPRGGTVLRAGDRLFVLVPRKNRADLEDVFSRWRRRV